MSMYLKALLDTYNRAEELGLVDVYDENGVGLRPIYHSSKKASSTAKIYNITVTPLGEFVSASGVLAGDYITYPESEKSATRTSSGAPHGLADGIKNMSGYFSEDAHYAYLNALGKWEQSEYATDMVRAVYAYVGKDTIVEDLKELGFKPNDKAFITFTLLTEDAEDLTLNEDKETHDSWIDYMRSLQYEKDLEAGVEDKGYSDLTGNYVYIPENYKGVLGMSKILSLSNKREPYIGRFAKKKKGSKNVTFKVGLEESLKIFNMIDYLAMNKSLRVYLTPANPVLVWTSDVGGVKGITSAIDENEVLLQFTEEEDELEKLSSLDTTTILKHLRRSQSERSFEELKDVYFLELFKINDGRLSVKNFIKMTDEDYDERLGYWYKTTAWEWSYGKDRNSLALKDLVLRLLGDEQEDMGKVKLMVNGDSADSLVNNLVNDLVRCKISLQRFPIHLYKKALTNARNRQRYRDTWQRELQAIMSVYKKYRWDYFREEVDELKDNTREVTDSYKVGQLLAVYERIEESANYYKGNQRVDTQVSKLWHVATQRPLYALGKIKQQTLPSVKTLKSKNKLYDLETRVDEYMADLAGSDTFKPNKPLADDFILGYYHERRELYSRLAKKEDAVEDVVE